MILLAGCNSDSSKADRGPGSADGGTADAAASTCPAPTAGPTNHNGFLKADETWSAAASPHIVTSDFTVPAGMTLTIEPCAEVRIQAGKYFYVNGKLLARGQADRRIVITKHVAERYASMWIRAPGSADLAYVDIDGGGGLVNSTAGTTVVVEGAWPVVKPLRVEHVRVRNSAGYGIDLRKWAGFGDGSTNLTVTGSGQEAKDFPYPIKMALNAMATLPQGTYTGNARDEIQIVGESPHYTVEVDDTIRNRGVPYHVGGNGAFGIITVQGNNTTPTLTIEAGVTVKFFSSASNVGGLFVGNTGSGVPLGRIVAVGTSAQAITFTGAGDAPVPGAWEGVTFFGAIAPDNRLEYVRIEAAGAHGGDSGFGCPQSEYSKLATDAALKVFSEPPTGFLKNSTISNSSSHGVYRAWKGGEVDFLPTNTFTNIVGCTQVMPAPTTGACPANPSCPKSS